jgi:hypothetical protein
MQPDIADPIIHPPEPPPEQANAAARGALLARYELWRRIVEVGFWMLFFGMQAGVNSIIVWLDMQRSGQQMGLWVPATWEWSSNMVLLALIPILLAFERRYPLQFGSLGRSCRFHVLGSMVFCLAHVGGMVAVRKLVYAANGQEYQFGNWLDGLAYEYLKDARAYAGFLLIVVLYRLLLLRLQGEARLLEAPDNGPPVEAIEHPERFLVRKLGKDFLLPAAEVEWLQAWGNYVNLRVRAHDYPLRSTMTAIEGRLDPASFVRVHRSYILNLNYVQAIEPMDSGDARAIMKDGSQVPISRRYRDSLRKLPGVQA